MTTDKTDNANKEENFDFFEQQDIMSGATSPQEVILAREDALDREENSDKEDNQ